MKKLNLLIIFLFLPGIELSMADAVSQFWNHESGITSVAVSSDGNWILAGSFERTVRLADFPTGKNGRFLFDERNTPIDAASEIPPTEVMAVGFSPDGKLAAAGLRDRTVRIWDVPNGQDTIVLRGYAGVLAIAFSPDSTLIAAGGHGPVVHLWEIQTGMQIGEFGDHGFMVRSLAFTSDGQSLVTTSNDGMVRIWNVLTGELEKKIDLTCGRIYGMDLNKNTSVLAAGCTNGQIVTLNQQFTNPRSLFVDRGVTVYSVDLSADGRLLVSGGGDEIARLWDVEKGEEIRKYLGHKGEVRSVVLSEMHRLIISGSQDGSIQMWNLDTGERIKIFGEVP